MRGRTIHAGTATPAESKDMSAAAIDDFEQIPPSSPPPRADRVVAANGGEEGPFFPSLPYIEFRLFELLAAAGLDGAGVTAVLAALPLAKPDRETPGLYTLKWAEDYCVHVSKMSAATVQRAKRQLKKAGLIKKINEATKGNSAVWDVSKLILIKKPKGK
jgi:hypothetical protein